MGCPCRRCACVVCREERGPRMRGGTRRPTRAAFVSPRVLPGPSVVRRVLRGRGLAEAAPDLPLCPRQPRTALWATSGRCVQTLPLAVTGAHHSCRFMAIYEGKPHTELAVQLPGATKSLCAEGRAQLPVQPRAEQWKFPSVLNHRLVPGPEGGASERRSSSANGCHEDSRKVPVSGNNLGVGA